MMVSTSNDHCAMRKRGDYQQCWVHCTHKYLLKLSEEYRQQKRTENIKLDQISRPMYRLAIAV